MSYWISLLNEKGERIEVAPFAEGGTYCPTGSTEANLNVTYNYAPHFRMLGNDGLRSLYGMKAKDTIKLLKDAIDALADDVDDDYWKPTEGNAKKALSILYWWAVENPEGIWEVH
jgi:hypothetical protein